jgi:anti-anti-sigma factor
MAGMMNMGNAPVMVRAGEMKEIVKGQEQILVDRLNPLVRCASVSLDLTGVERIDAAGLSALIRLYNDAYKAGYEFSVTRPSPHVREVLGLVGLDRLLAVPADRRAKMTAA